MFRLSREEIHSRPSNKLIQTMEAMFKAPSFDDLVEPVVKVEISTVFHEVFERYTQIFNPEGGVEKVYAFDATVSLSPFAGSGRTFTGL